MSSPQELDPTPSGRPPRAVRPGLWLFPPSRDSLGGSAWYLEGSHLDLLVDAPALNETTRQWLLRRAPRRGWIVLTGRRGHGRLRSLQELLGWPVLVQEQEAYLLPGVARLSTFAQTHQLAEGLELLWTPGPSPGACVLHARGQEAGDGLFCGRLLLPVGPGQLRPLHRRDTFHWPRQLGSVERLRDWLPAGSPDWIATGAALGALRGAAVVEHGSAMLTALDLEALRDVQPEGG